MLPDDPILLKSLGDAHLAELRAQAAARRSAGARAVPAWRNIAGRAMLSAALRLLGEHGDMPAVDPTTRTADHA